MNLAIVTGGSRGIGAALAETYSAEGFTVLELSRSGSGPRHMHLDLAASDRARSDDALTKITQKFGELARMRWEQVHFVNNAGLLGPVLPVHKLDDAAIANNLAVNMVGAIGVIARFVRAFEDVAAHKVIANISSGAALKGYFGWSLYCAAKAGMENFMRALAEEQAAAAHPFACVSIAPGVVDTAMQAEIRGVERGNFPDVGRFIQLKESGQLRAPAAVAATVLRILGEQPKNGERYSVADYAR